MRYNVNPINISDELQAEFIDNWLIKFPNDIMATWPNLDDTRRVIELGIVSALNASLTAMQIYDYFSISYPGIMHQSSCHEMDQEKIYAIFETAMKDIFSELDQTNQSK